MNCFLSYNIRVPQGSVLGPMLFFLFLNKLPTAVQHSLLTFTHKTSMYGGERDFQNPEVLLQNYITIIF